MDEKCFSFTTADIAVAAVAADVERQGERERETENL